MQRGESTGHSRNLRKRLKAARDEKGWTADHVGRLIGHEMGRRAYSGQAVLYWEAFERHPPIDTYAAWARVLGWKLNLDVVPQDCERTTVHLQSQEAVDIARIVDSMTEAARRSVLQMLRDLRR